MLSRVGLLVEFQRGTEDMDTSIWEARRAQAQHVARGLQQMPDSMAMLERSRTRGAARCGVLSLQSTALAGQPGEIQAAEATVQLISNHCPWPQTGRWWGRRGRRA